jgi:hypothetical protein
MSKNKKCKHFLATKYGWICARADTYNKECPPHSNWCCEIIPAKAKTKTVRAFGWFDDGHIHASADKEWCKGLGYFPVTVTYKIKDTK